jgi:hypothetical protein
MTSKRKIILGGLIAGTLDGVAAILTFSNPINLHNASRVFRYIAASLFGAQAIDGGLVFPFIGLAIHFLIATIWTALYIRIIFKIFKPGVVWAKIILYAATIWVIMNGFVITLAGLKAQYNGWSIMRSFSIILFCVSVPICLIGEIQTNKK